MCVGGGGGGGGGHAGACSAGGDAIQGAREVPPRLPPPGCAGRAGRASFYDAPLFRHCSGFVSVLLPALCFCSDPSHLARPLPHIL